MAGGPAQKDAFAARGVPSLDHYCGLGEPKTFRQISAQRVICRAFHRRGGDPEFERITVHADKFGSRGIGLDVDGENNSVRALMDHQNLGGAVALACER